MKLAIIIADTPHLKTEQVSLNLSLKGVYDITYLVVPFVSRPTRKVIVQHRPNQFDSVALAELAVKLDYQIKKIETLEKMDPTEFDYLLLTGGTLIPEDFVTRADQNIINCHPGLIPETRGLDAFKWAIYDGKAVGNTLHAIDAHVDFGTLFTRVITPVFLSDTLEQFATRHYEREIAILSEFEQYVHNPPIEYNHQNVGKPRKRMPLEKENRLPEAFENYKRLYA